MDQRPHGAGCIRVLNSALRPERQASSTFPVRLFEMINAAPATPAASVNAFSAYGHASGEAAACLMIETREGMANPRPGGRLAESC
jgi:hypothetical protein